VADGFDVVAVGVEHEGGVTAMATLGRERLSQKRFNSHIYQFDQAGPLSAKPLSPTAVPDRLGLDSSRRRT